MPDITIHQALATVIVTVDEARDYLEGAEYDVDHLGNSSAVSALVAEAIANGDCELTESPEYHDRHSSKVWFTATVLVAIDEPPTRLNQEQLIGYLDGQIMDAGWDHNLCSQTKRVTITEVSDHDTTYQVVASQQLLANGASPLPVPPQSHAASQIAA